MGFIDFILDVWDWMIDTGEIIIDFILDVGEGIGDFFMNIGDFFGDVGEGIGDFFMNIGDFFGDVGEGIGDFGGFDLEMGGLMFGILNCVIIFLLSKWMLKPFLEYMNPFGKIFWTILTYLGAFTLGYFLGEKLFGDN